MERTLDYYSYMSRSELRKLIIDIIGPTKDWPWAVKKSFVKKHWKNPERFKIIVFAMVNGCDPKMITSYMRKTGGYDRSAWYQVDWVIKNFPKKRWTAWHVALRRTQ